MNNHPETLEVLARLGLTTGRAILSGKRIEEILHNWHEAGRAEFERSYPNLNFDSPAYMTHFHIGAKYIRLDVGPFGAFMLDSETGLIYGIKAYGQVDKKKIAGDASDPNFTGASLYNLRFKRGAFNFAGRN